jgi:hypothetical protein
MSTDADLVMIRDVDPDDLREFRAAVTEQAMTVPGALRAFIHQRAEEHRRQTRGRRRAEAVALLRARSADPNLGGASSAALSAGLRADRDELAGGAL